VPPILPLDELAQVVRTDTKLGGKLYLRALAGTGLLSNVDHLFLGQFRMGMVFAPRLTLLRHHVSHVVCLEAEEQVRRIHASGIVTVMTDVHTLWDRTVRELPREAMSLEGCPSLASSTDDSVASLMGCPSPRPATRLCLFPDVPSVPSLKGDSSTSQGAGVGTEFTLATPHHAWKNRELNATGLTDAEDLRRTARHDASPTSVVSGTLER
jgi:hypothetical protein